MQTNINMLWNIFGTKQFRSHYPNDINKWWFFYLLFFIFWNLITLCSFHCICIDYSRSRVLVLKWLWFMLELNLSVNIRKAKYQSKSLPDWTFWITKKTHLDHLLHTSYCIRPQIGLNLVDNCNCLFCPEFSFQHLFLFSWFGDRFKTSFWLQLLKRTQRSAPTPVPKGPSRVW